MKTKILYLLISAFFISCGGNGDEPIPEPITDPVNEIPEWNKNNTAIVYIASNFTQKGLSVANYSEISNFFKINNFDVVILNRSDVDIATDNNGGISVTNNLKLYSFFNLNSFENSIVKGNTVIVKSPIEKLDTYKNNTARVSNSKTMFKGIELPLSITSIETEKQLNHAKKLLGKVITNNQVLFLETKTKFIDILKKTVSGYNDKYRVQNYVTKNDCSIVIISPKYWLIRDVSLSKEYTNDLDIYKVQIEANVFY